MLEIKKKEKNLRQQKKSYLIILYSYPNLEVDELFSFILGFLWLSC